MFAARFMVAVRRRSAYRWCARRLMGLLLVRYTLQPFAIVHRRFSAHPHEMRRMWGNVGVHLRTPYRL